MEEKELVKLIKKLLVLEPNNFSTYEYLKSVVYRSNYDRYYTITITKYSDSMEVTFSIQKDFFADSISRITITDERSKNEIWYAVSDIIDRLQDNEMCIFEKYLAEQEYKGLDSLLPDNAE